MTPAGFCQCGCGQRTALITKGDPKRGAVVGEFRRYRRGHAHRLRGDGPNPSGLCMCGCGAPTPLADRSDKAAGLIGGRPMRYLPGHHMRARMPKDGRKRSSGGYVLRHAPAHPRASGEYVFEHILIVELAIGRLLPVGAVVHHVNDTKDDNRNANLAALQNNSEHIALHRRRRVLRAGGNPWTQWLCSHCRQAKNVSEFYRRKEGRPHSVCKRCDDARRRAA